MPIQHEAKLSSSSLGVQFMISSIRSCAMRVPVLRATRQTVALGPTRPVTPHFQSIPRPRPSSTLVPVRFQHAQRPSLEELEKRVKERERFENRMVLYMFVYVLFEIGTELGGG